MKVDIAHDLGSGAGQADLLVQDLRFGEALQPEDLTRVALGVVANVQGAVSGTGQIRWDRNSVSSDGRFGTQDMSLAAAFGPVDRKSVVKGKRVSVRVDLVGRRINKKKKNKRTGN